MVRSKVEYLSCSTIRRESDHLSGLVSRARTVVASQEKRKIWVLSQLHLETAFQLAIPQLAAGVGPLFGNMLAVGGNSICKMADCLNIQNNDHRPWPSWRAKLKWAQAEGNMVVPGW